MSRTGVAGVGPARLGCRKDVGRHAGEMRSRTADVGSRSSQFGGRSAGPLSRVWDADEQVAQRRRLCGAICSASGNGRTMTIAVTGEQLVHRLFESASCGGIVRCLWEWGE